MYWRRPLTRLECALYAAAAAVLIGLFLERSLYLMELAERSAMEVTVQRINGGLRLRRATEIIAGRAASAAAPEDVFAFAYVAPPSTFAGAGATAEAPGLWRYDPAGGELVYSPRHRRTLKTAAPDGTVHFRLSRDESGLWVLAPAYAYAWP